MDRQEFYGVELTPTDRMTLAWLIIVGKHRCSRKIRRMRMMGEGSYNKRDLARWIDKLNRIKHLEKVLEELP